MLSKNVRVSARGNRVSCLPLLLVLLAQNILAQSPTGDALQFFNNWFLNGDYAVAGVGLADKGGSGTINMTATTPIDPSTGAPAQAYPIAAFLYWQTVENRAGQPVPAANGVFDGNPIVGRLLGSDAASACWVPANPSQTLRVYRADVLRFLPIDTATHLRRINGAHTVALGAAVAANTGVLATEGATLVVIYRVFSPANPSLIPLRSVVIYDGVFTLRDGQAPLTQTVTGYYQPSANPQATMTHIVGNGQSSFREVLTVDNAAPAGVSATQPFIGAQGRNWDNLSFPLRVTDGGGVSAKVTLSGDSPACLSWGAIVAATNVKDSDGDGLLDIWEQRGMHRNTQVSPATFGSCADYPNEPCVNLPAMGAVNGVKDLFVQLDWMHGFGDGTGGVDGSGSHSHIPKLDALTMVAKAFAAKGIAVHFDVGNSYQGQGLSFVVPYQKDAYGNQLAQGGSDIDESTLVCHDSPGHTCVYHESYPVLSFKLGFQSVKDGNHLLNISPHFAQDRKDVFHYGLFAHAVAGPFTLTGAPADAHPRSFSGVGDRPGGDFMITLGLWRSDTPANDQVGSVLVQAGTMMHEIGHNLGLSHAGIASTPNCVPNYPSVMSYLYQTRGLIDGLGDAQIDYSNGQLLQLNESSLSQASLGASPYRFRYYAPFNALLNSAGQSATVHCDGTPLNGDAPLVRLEADALGTPDWSNGTLPAGYTNLAVDINFDGVAAQILADQKDWASLNFQHLGSRASFGSISTGSLATDAGSLATDAGSLATDAGSLATDAGSLATDAGSLATDAGSLATDAGSLATDAGDEDYESHIRSTTDRIPTPRQCAGCGLFATPGLNAITLRWTPPDVGGALTYNVYRCAGAVCTPLPPALATGWMPPSKSAPTYTDAVNDFVHAGASCPANKTCYNTVYTYSVTAVSSAGVESPYSNTAGGEVPHLFVVADNQAVVYGSPNPAPAFKVYGDVAGSLNLGSVNCTYSGAARNAGSYAIVCTGPAATTQANGVTYNAAYLTYVPGTLTIAQRPISVTAAASSKVYDGTVLSAAIPSITTGSLAYNDTASWSETYDNKNAGTTHVMTPAGSVDDGNGGANYLVTFATIGTGVILKAGATIAVTPYNVPYDGMPHTAPGTATGVLGEALVGLNLSRTTHTNVGTFTDSWTFTNLNYKDAAGSINDVIRGVVATGSMVTARSYHTATLLPSGMVLVAGGFDTKNKPLANAELYDPATGAFVPVPDKMPNTAAGATATLLSNGQVLIAGGGNASTCLYDPAANVFNSSGGMGSQRTNHIAVLLPNGQVLIAGGSDNSGKTQKSAQLYDPATGKFTSTGDMTISREFHTATLVGGKVLITGGRSLRTNGSDGYTYLASAELYDPVTGVFTALANSMAAARYAHTALLANGKVLLAGGANANVLASAELYDPAAGTFTPAASPLNAARMYFTATMTAMGILEIGGFTSKLPLQSTESYQAGGFISGLNLITARFAHTATLLKNGSILVAGGIGSAGIPLASAEIF